MPTAPLAHHGDRGESLQLHEVPASRGKAQPQYSVKPKSTLAFRTLPPPGTASRAPPSSDSQGRDPTKLRPKTTETQPERSRKGTHPSCHPTYHLRVLLAFHSAVPMTLVHLALNLYSEKRRTIRSEPAPSAYQPLPKRWGCGVHGPPLRSHRCAKSLPRAEWHQLQELPRWHPAGAEAQVRNRPAM